MDVATPEAATVATEVINARPEQEIAWLDVGNKRLVQNFEAYLHQAKLGRRIVIQCRDGYRAALEPIPEKLRHRPMRWGRVSFLSRRLVKRWDWH